MQPDGKIVVAGTSINWDDDFQYDFVLVRFDNDGSLDTSFGTDGRVTTEFGQFAFANSLAFQPDGKIVVAGYTNGDNHAVFALARFTNDGTLDTSFGADGKVTTAIGTGGNVATAIALQEDGKIVVAGYGVGFMLARYMGETDEPPRVLANTGLDLSFGIVGKITTSIGISATAQAIGIQDDGKIVVAGSTQNEGVAERPSDFIVLRYESDGSLDSSFGEGGVVITDFKGGRDFATSLSLQPDGKIVDAGVTVVEGPSRFALGRYNSNGTLDATFGEEGQITIELGAVSNLYGMALQADGKIVVAGSTSIGINDPTDFALARFNNDGSLDLSFDGDGSVSTDLGGWDEITDLKLLPDGKIIVTGAGMARYNNNGTLDASFGDNGTTYCDPGRRMTVQADGKILVAGYDSPNGQTEFALARYNANGSVDTSFSEDGKLTTAIESLLDVAFSVVVLDDGKIVVAGFSATQDDTRFAFARYLPDGMLDTSFGQDGKVTTTFRTGEIAIVFNMALQADGKIVAAGSAGNDVALARYDFYAEQVGNEFMGQSVNDTPTRGDAGDAIEAGIGEDALESAATGDRTDDAFAVNVDDIPRTA